MCVVSTPGSGGAGSLLLLLLLPPSPSMTPSYGVTTTTTRGDPIHPVSNLTLSLSVGLVPILDLGTA